MLLLHPVHQIAARDTVGRRTVATGVKPVAGTEQVVNGDLGHRNREFPLAAVRPREDVGQRHAFTPRRAALWLRTGEEVVVRPRLRLQRGKRGRRVVERQVAEGREVAILVVKRTETG